MTKTTVIKIDTAPAVSSTQALRHELKQLKDLLLTLEKGTEDYNKAMTRAANIQHTLKDQMAELNASAMDFGQITSNITKATAGMVGAFQSVNALMGMFGSESEEALKAILKLQQSMALVQGLQAIEEGVKAFGRLGTAIKNSEIVAKAFAAANKLLTVGMGANAAATTAATVATQAFRAALVSTGIGAIVVAVGLLAANWDKVAAAIKNSELNTKDYKKEVDNINASFEYQQKLLEAQGANRLTIYQSEKAQLETIKKSYDEEFNNLQNRLIMNGKLSKSDEKRYDELIKLRDDNAKEINIINARITTEENRIAEEAAKKQGQLQADLNKFKEQKYLEDLAALKSMYDLGLITADEYFKRVEKLSGEHKGLGLTDVKRGIDLTAINEYVNLNKQLQEGLISILQYAERYEAIVSKASKAANTAAQNEYDKIVKITSELQLILDKAKKTQFIDADLEKYTITTLSIIEAIKRESFDPDRNTIKATVFQNLMENYIELLTNYAVTLGDVIGKANQAVLDSAKLTKRVLEDLGKDIDKIQLRDNIFKDYIYPVDDKEEEEKVDNTLLERIRKVTETYTQIRLTVAELYEQLNSDLDLAYKNDLITYEQYLEAKKNLSSDMYTQMAYNAIDILNEVGTATSNIGDAILANAEYQLDAGKITQEQYEEQVENAKAFNIAGVVISTLAGIANATASIWSPANSYLTVWGQIGMQAAITTELLASMATQIALIKRQSLSSAGSGPVSAGAVSSLIAPLQYTSNVEGASTEQKQKDTRVYVTEHDISDTINKVSVSQREATF